MRWFVIHLNNQSALGPQQELVTLSDNVTRISGPPDWACQTMMSFLCRLGILVDPAKADRPFLSTLQKLRLGGLEGLSGRTEGAK